MQPSAPNAPNGDPPAAHAGASSAQRSRAGLLGLLVPGGGQAAHGDFVAALTIASATAFLWLAAALEIVVHNRPGFPAPLHLWTELGALRWPLTIVPEIPVVVIFALTLHLGAAWMAWTPRFGGPRASWQRA